MGQVPSPTDIMEPSSLFDLRWPIAVPKRGMEHRPRAWPRIYNDTQSLRNNPDAFASSARAQTTLGSSWHNFEPICWTSGRTPGVAMHSGGPDTAHHHQGSCNMGLMN